MSSPRITAALELLEAPSPVQRSEALDQLTTVLQELNWQLNRATDLSAKQLMQALRSRLSDSNWLAPLPCTMRSRVGLNLIDFPLVCRSVSQKCMLLIGDLVCEPDPEVRATQPSHTWVLILRSA